MKIAVFMPNWIGDAVMATPALRALRQHFAGAKLVGVLRPYVAGVLEGTGWLDEEVLLGLATTGRDERAADEVWGQAGLGRHPEVVCLNPGAAFGSAKHWPLTSFARLAQEFVDRRGSGVLVLCGPGEQPLAREIVRL